MIESISPLLANKYLSLFNTPSSERTNQQLEEIMKITKNVTFFHNISEENKSPRIHWECCRAMTLEAYQAGECVFHFGEIGDKFYAIISGKISVWIPTKTKKSTASTVKNEFHNEKLLRSLSRHSTDFIENKQENEFSKLKKKKTMIDFEYLDLVGEIEEMKEIKVLFPGDSFGEVALLSNKPRSATVKCKENSVLAVISQKDYKKILSSNARKIIQEKYTYFSSFPLFRKISQTSIKNLSYMITEASYKKNEIVYCDKSECDLIYFIKLGEFKITVKEQLKQRDLNHSCKSILKLKLLTNNSRNVHHDVVIKSNNEIFGYEILGDNGEKVLHSCICTSNYGMAYIININVNCK